MTEASAEFQNVLLEESAFETAYHDRLRGAPPEGLNDLTLQYASRVTGVDKAHLYAALIRGTAQLKKIGGYPIASQTEWFVLGNKTHEPLFSVQSHLESTSLQPLPDEIFTPSTDGAVLADLPDLPSDLVTQ